jgi:predicted GIY-YIG superfamily endonuclease
MPEKKRLFLYLISHSKRDIIKTHTYIGATADFNHRLKQHNCELVGGPRITRRASPNWKPIMILELPAKRTFSSKKLKKEWKQSSRGLESRIRKGLEIAFKYKINIFLTNKKNHSIKILSALQKRRSKNETRVNLSPQEWDRLLTGENI